MKRMVIDISNLFFRAIAAQLSSGNIDSEAAGLGLHTCLTSIAKHYRAVKPDELAVSFEGSNNWRKTYTKSDECVSKRIYKANRVKDPSMDILFDVIAQFRELIEKHSSIICLHHPLLEGDDALSAYVQEGANAGDEVVILSGDKDFVGLLKFPTVKLLNPDGDKYRTLEEVCGVDDADYFIFEKCFRGDSGDNVLSAYPRVRKTKLQSAFKDDFVRLGLLSHEWKFSDGETGEERTMNVGKLFEENKLLMDLIDGQPEHIKKIMRQLPETARMNKGKYNIMAFAQFCGKHELSKVRDNVGTYSEIFSLNQKRK